MSIVQKEGSSVEANINSELTPEQEAELDRIVDTTGVLIITLKD